VGSQRPHLARYRRVYDKITREIRARKRLQRKSIIARLRAAVQLNEITGSVRALTGFRRMEKQNSGEVSGTCSLLETREGTKNYMGGLYGGILVSK